MAKFEKDIDGDIDAVISLIETGLLSKFGMKLKDQYDYYDIDPVRLSVRVFDALSYRKDVTYSAYVHTGLSVTIFQDTEGKVHVVGITTGAERHLLSGSDTWGERDLLEKLIKVLL